MNIITAPSQQLHLFELVIPPPPPPNEIIRILNLHRMPLEEWGTGKWWSLDDFIDYMSNCQFWFRSTTFSPLTIDVNSAVVMVYHNDNGRLKELYEACQVSRKTGERMCRDNFDGIAETMNRGAQPRDEAARCLSEELKFKDPSLYDLSELLHKEDRDPAPSEKWPGPLSVYHRHVFRCDISQTLYDPKGYVEHEKDRDIYFEWRDARNVLCR